MTSLPISKKPGVALSPMTCVAETEKLLLKLLQQHPSYPLSGKLRRYLAASRERAAKNREINAINCKKWKKINVQAIPIVGVFEAEGLPTMNFMNGFEHQGTFFTNGASEEIFEEEFVEQIKKFCPNLNIIFVLKEDNKGLMEFYLTNTNGGLNCMSWMYGPVAPLSFPTNRKLEREIEPGKCQSSETYLILF